MKKFGIITIGLFLVLSVSSGFAQLKIGYVDSQRILQEYQEAIDAQNKLEEIRAQYQAEYESKVREYQEMAQSIESQSLLLSEEKKQEKMKKAQDLALQIDKYKYDKLGPEGEYYRKNIELTKPIIEKINNIIKTIGDNEEYDFILDASQGALLHALPKYDLTENVLAELNKGVSSTSKK